MLYITQRNVTQQMSIYNHERHGNILVTEHVKLLIEKDKRERCPQRTEEWYQKRNNHLTASAIATAVGANKYEKKSVLIKRKTGLAPAFKGNAATEHGNKYEFTAIEKYEQSTGQKVIEFGLLKSLNEGEDFIAGSPDGITASGRLIEVKCPLRRKIGDFVPDMYKYQIQTLMHILHLDSCDFIQYKPETIWTNEVFVITHVKYEPQFWLNIFPQLQRCWEEILDTRERIAARKGLGGGDESNDDEEDDKDDDNMVKNEKMFPNGKEITITEKKTTDIVIDMKSLSQRPEFTKEPDWSGMEGFFANFVK